MERRLLCSAPKTDLKCWGGQATKAGYKVCLSGGWYLDSLKTTPGHFDGWDYYLQEPTDFEGTDAQKKLVMGGKAAMWGEHVDATNLLSRTWPRASCVAERLWSPQSVKDEEAAKPRLHKFRCDMIARGIPAEPISPGGSIPGVPVQGQNAPGYCPHEYVFNYAPPGSGSPDQDREL